VARDHQVLVGRDHPDRAGAFVGTDDRVMAGVPLGIEADAEMLESGTVGVPARGFLTGDAVFPTVLIVLASSQPVRISLTARIRGA